MKLYMALYYQLDSEVYSRFFIKNFILFYYLISLYYLDYYTFGWFFLEANLYGGSIAIMFLGYLWRSMSLLGFTGFNSVTYMFGLL